MISESERILNSLGHNKTAFTRCRKTQLNLFQPRPSLHFYQFLQCMKSCKFTEPLIHRFKNMWEPSSDLPESCVSQVFHRNIKFFSGATFPLNKCHLQEGRAFLILRQGWWHLIFPDLLLKLHRSWHSSHSLLWQNLIFMQNEMGVLPACWG